MKPTSNSHPDGYPKSLTQLTVNTAESRSVYRKQLKKAKLRRLATVVVCRGGVVDPGLKIEADLDRDPANGAWVFSMYFRDTNFAPPPGELLRMTTSFVVTRADQGVVWRKVERYYFRNSDQNAYMTKGEAPDEPETVPYLATIRWPNLELVPDEFLRLLRDLECHVAWAILDYERNLATNH